MELDLYRETAIRVRYGETDQMGYCYYGNYAQYFEVGRVEALREIGMTYKRLEEQGVMLPVLNYEVSFKLPAKYDDVLQIKTHIKELRGSRLIFDYIVTNESNQLIAEASTTLVFVSKKSMKPIAPPEIFLKKIDEYIT